MGTMPSSQVARIAGNNSPFLRSLAAEDTRSILDDLSTYDAFRDGFLILCFGASHTDAHALIVKTDWLRCPVMRMSQDSPRPSTCPRCRGGSHASICLRGVQCHVSRHDFPAELGLDVCAGRRCGKGNGFW
ncbi:hypothetical protein LXA43DRAFT_490549 [Ganoderma leucocontextum]|nr:hypothetical protein LXA43DRAFT_490549 [Ganoderma leucocontextum]